MKKVYISGKISGLEESVYTAKFQEAEDKLTALGFKVVNPVKIVHNHDNSWLSFMREDLKEMLDCDGIYMLGNWMDSKGAKIEHDLCVSLGIPIWYESDGSISPKSMCFTSSINL